ncbi:MAG: hypothetical protein V3U67_01155, partial [Gemmatimonadota bacterium]
RWPCRAGDYVLWLRWFNPIDSPDGRASFRIMDSWELRDGDHILLTGRECDLPPGASDPSAGAALNVWQPLPGDRLAWSGRPRNRHDDDAPVLLGLVECLEPIVVYGDSARPRTHPEFPMQLFGEPTSEELTPHAYATMGVAWKAAISQPAMGAGRDVNDPEDALNLFRRLIAGRP